MDVEAMPAFALRQNQAQPPSMSSRRYYTHAEMGNNKKREDHVSSLPPGLFIETFRLDIHAS